MNTTSLIVEVLVGGFITLIWVLLIVIKLYNVDLATLQDLLLKYKDWSGYVLFATMAFSYQIGWLMIHASYIATTSLIVKPLRKKIFGSQNASSYRKIKNTVYSNASDELMKGIEKDRSVIRLSRAGLLNFIILAVVLLAYHSWWLALISIIIGLVCLLQMISVYESLYTKFDNSYTELKSSYE